jgi:hypothetical protein
MEIMSDQENPTLKLDAKGLLDFIDAQNRKEREYFDRLLKWLAGVVAIVLGVFAFFGYQDLSQVRKVGDEIREETKKQLSAAVKDELTKEKIQDQIGVALERKTEAQFQDAINKAVAGELNTPQRQRLLEAATQRQVDALTKHLQDRERILRLGDNAIGLSPTGRSALVELSGLSKKSPDAAVREAAGQSLQGSAVFGGQVVRTCPGGIELRA